MSKTYVVAVADAGKSEGSRTTVHFMKSCNSKHLHCANQHIVKQRRERAYHYGWSTVVMNFKDDAEAMQYKKDTEEYLNT